ncbi:hypothetical protein [Mycobacterium sp. Root265]|uniref:hypothetical protein n=1 Tax=Mycobacterium sp. Root265 TaxID=1736504 RepID=UPI0012E341FC|nr:hypothetical protein [Mycobacterium sp. Root265]
MSTILPYWEFTARQDDPVTCPQCGWVGPPSRGMEQHRDLLDVTCPQCGTMLLIIPFPTAADTRQAAAAGNAKAIAEIPRIDAQEQRWREDSATELRTPGQLPEIDGDELVIDWDTDHSDTDRPVTVLRHGDRELWREACYWEGYGRFNQVAKLLRQRYGRRVVELRPTSRSEMHLYGDRWAVGGYLDKVNAALRGGINSDDPQWPSWW